MAKRGPKGPRARHYITFRFPDRPRAKAAQTKGRLCGMGICQFIATLFEVNETLPKSKKFTDETISQMILREYEGRSVVEKLRRREVTIGYWRTLFNQGLLIGSVKERKPPQIPSRRYNEDGEWINPRTGKLPDDIETAKHGGLSERAWLLEKERALQEKVRALAPGQKLKKAKSVEVVDAVKVD